MKRTTKKLLIVAVTAALFAPMTAMATNGYFAHGYGIKNKAMAGGGAALPQDSMIAATNPAGMVFVGERLDVGAAIFSPNPRGYEATGTPTGACATATQCTFGLDEGKVTSGDDMFLVPHIASNWMLDANSSIGVTVYGNGGMNTNYDSSDASATFGFPLPAPPPGTSVTSAGTYGAGRTGVNLSQLFVAMTYARKFNDKSSWGVTPVFVYQRFEAKGLDLFGAFGMSNDASKLSNNGVDTSTGYGLKLGVQSEVAPGLSLAASYQSRMEMTEFDKYAGLFAEEGDFDVPPSATVGLAWSATPTMVVTADVQAIYYSQVKSIANPISHLTSPTGCGNGAGDTTQCLGGSDGAGFGWEDMTIFKLGFQMQQSADLTLRAGLSYGDQPIPESETLFNIIAPAVITTHITFGLTKKLSSDSEFNFAGMYAPNNSVKGDNPFDPAQEVEIEMSQWELEGSYSMNF